MAYRRAAAHRIEIGVNQPSWLEFITRSSVQVLLAMPIAITSELRNQLKVLYRFDRGIALGPCLYHLKKPFHVLETLANNARCCVLSTRVGARSVATTEIREEPIAYLLDNREANNDPARRRLKPMKGRCFPFAGNCATTGPDCQHLHGRSLAR